MGQNLRKTLKTLGLKFALSSPLLRSSRNVSLLVPNTFLNSSRLSSPPSSPSKFALPLVSAKLRMFLLRSFPDSEMTAEIVPTSSATSKEELRRKARPRLKRTSRECARSPDLTRECANNSSPNTWTRSSMLFPLLTPARSASSPECAKQRNINCCPQRHYVQENS